MAAPHGVQGEVRCAILTDFPDRFQRTKRVFAGDGRAALDIERARLVRGAVVLKLVGVDSRADAEKLRGVTLSIPEEEAVPLDEGSFFWYQIIGLHVQTTDGEPLGIVADILQTGSNDVYVVRHGDTSELLLPAISDVVKSVDLEQKLIVVDLIEGLR